MKKFLILTILILTLSSTCFAFTYENAYQDLMEIYVRNYKNSSSYFLSDALKEIEIFHGLQIGHWRSSSSSSYYFGIATNLPDRWTSTSTSNLNGVVYYPYEQTKGVLQSGTPYNGAVYQFEVSPTTEMNYSTHTLYGKNNTVIYEGGYENANFVIPFVDNNKLEIYLGKYFLPSMQQVTINVYRASDNTLISALYLSDVISDQYEDGFKDYLNYDVQTHKLSVDMRAFYVDSSYNGEVYFKVILSSRPTENSAYLLRGFSCNTIVDFTSGGTTPPSGGGGSSFEPTPTPGGNTTDVNGSVDENGDINITMPDYTENLGAINDNLNNIGGFLGSNLDEESGSNEFNNLVDNLQNDLQEKFSSNAIFSALELAETGFINIISGTADDFKLEWNSVNYYDSVLIPAGSINFSQMCRDIEILGIVKQYLNIILSAFLAFALVKYLYNLVLATLGIDNPLLFENSSESDYITETQTLDKGKINTTYTHTRKIKRGGTQ